MTTNSQVLDVQQIEPWYRQGWPWFLFGLPAVVVIAGIATLIIANWDWDGPVVDDYYKEGLAVVMVIDKFERARSLGLTAHLSLRDGSVSIGLSSTQGSELPEKLQLKFIHPTRNSFDKQVLLKKGLDALYSGTFAPLSAGRWEFQIEDESQTWRMSGTAHIPTETEVEISPSNS
jgi:hypothetical protein